MATVRSTRTVRPEVRARAAVLLIVVLVVEPLLLFGAYAIWLAARSPADRPLVLLLGLIPAAVAAVLAATT